VVPPVSWRRLAPLVGFLLGVIVAPLWVAGAPLPRPGENLFDQQPSLRGAAAAEDPGADRKRPTYLVERLGSATSWRLNIPAPGERTEYIVRLPGERLSTLPPGQLVRISALARGRLRAGPEVRDVTLGIELRIEGDHRHHGFEARVPARPGRGGTGAFTGDFEWMPVELLFRLPANTRGLEARFFSERVHGQLEWKLPRIEVVGAGRPTVEVPGALATLQELATSRSKEEEERAAATRLRLAVPPPEQIYTPGPGLEAKEPRLFFAAKPPAEWAERWKAPAHAEFLQRLGAHVAALSATMAEPDFRDGPGRAQLARQTSNFPMLALAWLGSPDDATHTAAASALEALAPDVLAEPPAESYERASAELFDIALAYDWLRDRASPAVLAPLRLRTIELARHLRDPLNREAARVRNGPAWLAPELLADRTALAAAAAALWTDTAPPLQPGEPRGWMDEAMTWYSLVWRALPTDGTAIEGFGAQEDTLGPMLDFAALAETLTIPAQPPLDHPAFKRMSAARIALLLPDRSGSLSFGPPAANAAPALLPTALGLLAQRHADPGAAALAAALRAGAEPPPDATAEPGHRKRRERRERDRFSDFDWRALFWTVNAPPAAGDLSPPVQADFPDLGISTARGSTPAGTEFLFALKCGSPTGKNAEALGADFTEPRAEPDAGSFALWRGGVPVIQGVRGTNSKSSHGLPLPLLLPNSDEPGRPAVGQISITDGQGNPIANPPPAQLRATVRELTRHTWLCDLGERYREGDHPWKPLRPPAATQVLRRVVMLPRGLLVIADRIKPAEGRGVEFRIPIPSKDAALESNVVTWTVGNGSARLTDWSPGRNQRSLESERFMVTDGEISLPVFRLRTPSPSTVVYAIAIGLDGADKGITVSADTQRVRISGLPEGFVQFDWEK
jgi:hypothetical protein